ncbi:hypothetical protein [Fodinibius sediminis]|uniref:Uncharacterized protein n=1 Tax=Fodinibius sediminis TaxID=1214077 RepID=A0A521CGC6_9BACT|nr:hypothetical protein [Fodinibius sediminis]SMO58469.1 hypothetical protein SAMN06265218_10652 [Fodinibius sediminis]
MKGITAIVVCSMAIGCASVPKESIELSATVGRDLAVVHQAHREMARMLFASMRSDVNRYIDEVYTPYQIQHLLDRQQALADSEDPEDRQKSILAALAAASKPDTSPELQRSVRKGMNIMIQRLQRDLQSMRNELLEPLNNQEQEVLGSIDRAYQQLHYANSIVTGHLSSVRKVHDTQDELLESMGVERNLRTKVARQIANTSTKIEALVASGENMDERLDKAEQTSQAIKKAIEKLGENLRVN